MDCSTPGLPIHHQLLELTQTHVHWVGDAIQLSHPLSSPSPPAFNLSSIRVFSSELVHRIRWPKYCSFSINPSNEYLGLISFRTDWISLQSKRLFLQYHSSKASILWCSAFFIAQLSYPYMTTGKTTALEEGGFLTYFPARCLEIARMRVSVWRMHWLFHISTQAFESN